MGSSRDQFTKYPRTPHLFGSKGTDDDKHLSEAESKAFISDPSLIVEEKLDGTNIGIHFSAGAQMVLQCRGHLISEGMHPQYDLFKQWAAVKQQVLHQRLGSRYLLYGEWVYARHSISYTRLTHYFYEFDIYDKERNVFLDLTRRLALIDGVGIQTVPVIHRGALRRENLEKLIQPSGFGAIFDNPTTGRPDNLMEGLYLRTEADGVVTRRAKFVRCEFVEKLKQSIHWQHRRMEPNLLLNGVDIWL